LTTVLKSRGKGKEFSGVQAREEGEGEGEGVWGGGRGREGEEEAVPSLTNPLLMRPIEEAISAEFRRVVVGGGSINNIAQTCSYFVL
jgi:hypothetical protein